ncbi:TPA: hypothetical protein DIC20_03980 [Candidatus Dependentiae bacterium]|nr:hypothetical protein [Candidatus Dependentiae bacterium]HCU00836.1 hypothetical protein [Candidatus Dependentiae bacterium]
MKTIAWVLVPLFLTSCSIPFLNKAEKDMDVCAIKEFNDVINLFPKTAEEINQRVQNLKIEVKSAVQKIIAIPNDKRIFANTVQAMDDIGVLSSKTMSPIGLLREVSPEEPVRNASYAAILEWQPFAQEEVSKNIKLFEAFKAYFDGNAKKEKLNAEERYYLDETMKAYVREGLLLSSDKLEQVKKLQTELTELTLKFSKNIADVDTRITFSKEELAGVPESVIASLKKDEQGNYLAGMDYPTVFPIMKFSTNAQTRKKMYEAFQNRAYPANFPVLKNIMNCREKLAHLLGFENYVAYDLDNTMAKSSKNVQELLQDVMNRARDKESQEFKNLVTDVPSSVELTEDGTLLPWDVAFLKEEYKKKNLAIDDKKLTEYFPVEHVIPTVLSIYEHFLGLRFEEFNCEGLWASKLNCIRVYDNGRLRGFLILDLYPRPNKFSHACMVDVVSPRLINEKIVCPALIAILANFPEGSKEFPGLLKFGDVRTFFHEFGHAMHGLLGATQMHGFAGTSVKFDFVETPSQMFEEWLNDKDVLKKLSHHYQTGESLSDDNIEKLIELDKFDAGDRYLRQIGLSLFSLQLFDNSDHDIQEFYKEIMTFTRPNIVFDDKDHGAASFGHLTEYASKYYSYLWAQIYSMDLFETIKKQGLLNSEVGKKVAHEILSKGGSVEPAVLLRKFLGREPSQDAFLRHFGFES